MNIYKRIRDKCDDYQDWVQTQVDRNPGLPIRPKVTKRIEDIVLGVVNKIHWGYGKASFYYTINTIELPIPKQSLRGLMLYSLAHEYGHALQERDGHVWAKRRRLTSGYLNATGALLWEEWDASIQGLKLLLDEDALHPKMIGWAALLFGTYLASAIANWSCKRVQQKERKNIDAIFIGTEWPT